MIFKILKEALIQQKETEEEDWNAIGLFEEDKDYKYETEEEIDACAGFSQTQNHSQFYQQWIRST